MSDFGDTSLDIDSLDLGSVDRVLFIAIGSNPSAGLGHQAEVGTRAYGGEGTPVTGMVFVKMGTLDTEWIDVSGTFSSFGIALNAGGICQSPVTGASFSVALNAGGQCAVSLV